MNKMKIFNNVIILWMLIQCNLVFASPEEDSLLQEMINMYHDIQTYEDSGYMNITYFQDGTIKYEDKKMFQTHYSDESKFRFEWIDLDYGLNPKFNIIWKNDETTKILIWEEELESVDNIMKALSSVTGVSGGISTIVPKYIIKQTPCLEQEKQDYSIKYYNYGDKEESESLVQPENLNLKTIWIDSKTLLIKKVVKWRKLTKYVVKETIFYENIKVNEKIDADTFAINEKIILDQLKESLGSN